MNQYLAIGLEIAVEVLGPMLLAVLVGLVWGAIRVLATWLGAEVFL